MELEGSTDGLTLSRSNPHQFWPIQYSVTNIEWFKSAIAGIYKSLGKPSKGTDFLKMFIKVVQEAKKVGDIEIP